MGLEMWWPQYDQVHTKLLHLEASWFSLEQNSCLVVDKLSSTSVDFIRSEWELKKTAYMESNRLTEHFKGGSTIKNLHQS